MNSHRLHMLMHGNARQDCEAALVPGDTLVLADQALPLLLAATPWPDGVALAVLEADREARGLPVDQRFAAWSDADLVDAVAAHPHVLSWY